MERAGVDALVGPTFAEIIADQFSRFRRGDRYFFEHSPAVNPGAFTEAQLQQLRLTTMARVICDNSDGYGLSSVSPRAFRLPHVHGFVYYREMFSFFSTIYVLLTTFQEYSGSMY